MVASDSPSATCADDASLFEYAQGGLGPEERRTVEAHVNICEDCRHVLAEALRGLADSSDGAERGPDSSPRRIGRYALLELLGAGASGVVYRAFDPELERTVALKLLRTDASEMSTESRERRLREARTMAQVSDPNVVTVFDAGLSGGAVYIVMEHVRGCTLEEWLARGRPPLRDVVDAFMAAGRGLSALHARSIIHRDFKPENVMVGEDGRIQVTDFGLARPVAAMEATSANPGSALGSRTTLTQGLFGTPAYMAPELFEGRPADAQSDQFSFAVALLSAVTGHHPFGADEHISVSELVLRLHGDRRNVVASAARLPGRLRDALVRALSVEPGARFSSMSALLSELEHAPIPGPHRTAQRALWAVATLLVAGGALAFALGAGRRAGGEPRPGSSVVAQPAQTTVVPEPLAQASPGDGAAVPARAAKKPERAAEASSAPPHRTATVPGHLPARKAPRAAPAPSESRYDDRLKDPF